MNFALCSGSRIRDGLKVMVWLAPLGRLFMYPFQSPAPSADIPPSAFPTELVLAVGPFTSAPFDGQIALERNWPFGLPSALAAMTYPSPTQ